MTVLENITLYYNQLPLHDTKRQILRNLLPNLNRIGRMNIQEVADLCYTSPASISRLIRAMGYKNFSVFQSSVNESIKRYDFDNRFVIHTRNSDADPKSTVLDEMRFILHEFEENVEPEQVEALADLIHESPAVCIFAYGIRFMESALQSDILYSGIPCDIILGDSDQADAANMLREGSLAIFLCPDAIDSISPLSGSVRTVKEHGCKVAIISSTGQQAFTSMADFLMSFHGHRTQSDSFYIEMLLAAVTMAYRKKYIP